MNVYVRRETWATAGREIHQLVPQHHKDINEVGPFDERGCLRAEAQGRFVLLVARDGSASDTVVGYQFSRLFTLHLASAGLRCATSDAWFVAPYYRGLKVGGILLREAESTLRNLGVQKFYIGARARGHSNVEASLSHLGFKPSELVMEKDL